MSSGEQRQKLYSDNGFEKFAHNNAGQTIQLKRENARKYASPKVQFEYYSDRI